MPISIHNDSRPHPDIRNVVANVDGRIYTYGRNRDRAPVLRMSVRGRHSTIERTVPFGTPLYERICREIENAASASS